MSAPVTQRPGGQPSKLPAGVRMSKIWRGPDRALVDGVVEMPVDQEFRLTGALWLCQRDDCPTTVWVHSPDPQAKPEQTYCTQHPLQLVPAPLNPAERDPIAAARQVKASRLRQVFEARRGRALEAARLRADVLRGEAEALARRTAADLHGHVPSLSASAGALLAGAWATEAGGPLVAGAAGVVLSTFGAVAAYLVVYAWERWRHRLADAADPFVGRRARRARGKARHIAAGVLALGAWLLVAAATGADPGTYPGLGAWLLAGGLVWAVNRGHWEELWETRRRLAGLARMRAEKAAAHVVEVAERPVVVDETDPLVVGARMAEQWARFAQDPTAPLGFDMRRTRIVVEETRPLEAPGPDGLVRIGWEFTVAASPGVFVARIGGGSPLVAAEFRAWLASMLDRDAATVSTAMVAGKPNRGTLILSDGLPLGATVPWKGPAGIRRTRDGAIFGHAGRALTGEDVEEALYVPGQPSGGLTVGTTGGGKSAAQIVRFLNLLAAGIFPMLHDPKNFIDYIDFLGVFPMVALPEHRDVMLDALWCERERREKFRTTNPRADRHGRARTGDPIWNLRYGPPIRAAFDEFHMNIRHQQFVTKLTTHVRAQRATAISVDLLSQGGGLADFADSVLRGLVADVRLELYRVSDHLARLAGYNGEFSPSQLPRLPGMCLSVTPDAPEVPMRSAFVTRDDVDGSVYDWLYHPDGSPLLQAPALPPETLDVFERTGLMDLWRLGRGPNGAERLLSATNTPDVGGVAPANGQVATGPRPKAENVVLAILHVSGGLEFATDIGDHGAWQQAPGWGKAPALSTVTRATEALQKAGAAVKDAAGRLVPAGEGVARAKAWAEALGLVAGELPLPPGAVAERDVELRREERLVAEATAE